MVMWILWILFPKTNDSISRLLFMQSDYCYWLIYLNLTVQHFPIEKGHKVLEANGSSCRTPHSLFLHHLLIPHRALCLHDPYWAELWQYYSPACRALSQLLLRTSVDATGVLAFLPCPAAVIQPLVFFLADIFKSVVVNFLNAVCTSININKS